MRPLIPFHGHLLKNSSQVCGKVFELEYWGVTCQNLKYYTWLKIHMVLWTETASWELRIYSWASHQSLCALLWYCPRTILTVYRQDFDPTAICTLGSSWQLLINLDAPRVNIWGRDQLHDMTRGVRQGGQHNAFQTPFKYKCDPPHPRLMKLSVNMKMALFKESLQVFYFWYYDLESQTRDNCGAFLCCFGVFVIHWLGTHVKTLSMEPKNIIIRAINRAPPNFVYTPYFIISIIAEWVPWVLKRYYRWPLIIQPPPYRQHRYDT